MGFRIALDAQYIEGLKVLTTEYNEESNGVVDGLLIPVLTQLKHEIDSRILANKDAYALLAILPDLKAFQQNLSIGLADLANAKKSYRDVIEAKDAAKAVPPLDLTRRLSDPEPLPDEDRRYRKSVIVQNLQAKQAENWLHTYPSILVQYQDFLEKWWHVLKQASIININLVTSLSCNLSACRNALEAFSPISSIASADSAYEIDRENAIVKSATYCNYHAGGAISPILFGADLFLPDNRLEVLVGRIQSKEDWRDDTSFIGGYRWSDVFDEELTSGGIVQYMKLRDKSRISALNALAVELRHYDSLIPFRKDLPYNVHQSYPSRRALLGLLEVPPQDPPHVLPAMGGLTFARSRQLAHQISKLAFCHPTLALGSPVKLPAPLILTSWGKWDFIHWCPLPDGVKRDWFLEEDRVIVKVVKTGEEYYPDHWKSADEVWNTISIRNGG
ncbi:hypothetical protein FRC17_003142 [Serendipita sp. 399]|nr:hypothetical protein FRC17_003142 [Serendipita sp. 399]